VRKFFSRAGAISQELCSAVRVELAFAAPDQGFFTKDVIHKSGGPVFPLWKFIRSAQFASDRRRRTGFALRVKSAIVKGKKHGG